MSLSMAVQESRDANVVRRMKRDDRRSYLITRTMILKQMAIQLGGSERPWDPQLQTSGLGVAGDLELDGELRKRCVDLGRCLGGWS